MLRNTSLIVCLALAALTAGCSNPPPAPPPDTRAADLQAVKDVEAAWVKDMATKDADKFASFLADDASGLYPGAGILNGKAAIKAAFAPYFADPNFSLTWESTRAMASKGGDMVYSGHLHHDHDQPEDQEAHDGQGKVSDGLHQAG